VTVRVHRFPDAAGVFDGVADLLAHRLAAWPPRGKGFSLCVSDGLGEVGDALPRHMLTIGANPARLILWWSDDSFVDITDPSRVSTKTLAAFGGLPFAAGNVHPMPTPSGFADVDAAAAHYAAELGNTVFDLALLTLAADGGVAGLQPRTAEESTHTVLGQRSAGVERLTLTLDPLKRSTAVWMIAIGEATAPALARVVADDATLPGGALRGRRETLVFADEAAASCLPWYECDL